MNNCLNCGKPVNNKYCNTSCQNKHQGGERENKKYGILSEFNVTCNRCGKEFFVKERSKLFPQKEEYYCSRKCANKRIHSDETKNKIKLSVIKYNTESSHSSEKSEKNKNPCDTKLQQKQKLKDNKSFEQGNIKLSNDKKNIKIKQDDDNVNTTYLYTRISRREY